MNTRNAVLAAFLVAPLAAASLQADVPAPDPDYQKVRQLIRLGEADAAIEIAEKLVKKDDTRADYHLALGMAYGEKARRVSMFAAIGPAKKCKREFERAVELDPKSAEARYDLFLYYVNAPGIMGGDMTKAKQQAAEIGKLEPARGHVALALLAMKEKDLPRAEAEYRKVIETEPTKASSYSPLIGFFIGQSKPAEALAVCRKGFEVLPDDVDLHYQMARIAALSGMEPEAGLAHAEKFLAREPRAEGPSWADGHWRKGMILERQGKKQEAIAAYQQALKLAPLHPASKELKRLAK